ncbi:hypothetical protein EVAR_74612_1 [Eumeta japonica]|uniref:Uncharacterized protein n=1 Tax=Eumeta variegata TaxID=151549 RepID=A0A4C1WD98_EUMVA|nr:hypothetical protein EVAR_74612_1 [Eumeta japonica]
MTTAFKADWSSHQGTISTTLQDTEQPSPQLTPARRSSKWDAAERHQSSRRPPHELVVRTRVGLLNSASRPRVSR